LAEVLRFERSPRSVLWLVEQLPPTSATSAALRGNPELRWWGLAEHALIAAVDAIQANTIASVQVHSKKRLKPPKAIPRPQPTKRQAAGRKARRGRVVTVRQLQGLPPQD